MEAMLEKRSAESHADSTILDSTRNLGESSESSNSSESILDSLSNDCAIDSAHFATSNDFILQVPMIRVDTKPSLKNLATPQNNPYYEKSVDFSDEVDFIIKEERVSFYLNGTKIISTMCLPHDQDAHILGFLFNEGVIESYSAVRSIKVAKDGLSVFIEAKINEENIANLYHEKTLTSGCCVGVSANFDGKVLERFVSSKVRFNIADLCEKIAEFEKESELFNLTGCVHKVMIFCGNSVFQSEDIGRHNALDKAIGKAIMAEADLSGAVLIVSGRLSMEMVIKCAMSGIPLVISRAATTALGIKSALKLGITLVGFARNGKLNIYTHKARIV